MKADFSMADLAAAIQRYARCTNSLSGNAQVAAQAEKQRRQADLVSVHLAVKVLRYVRQCAGV